MSNPIFKIAKFLDVGTNNKICNRLSLQFFEIIDKGCSKISIEERDGIMEHLMDCMKDLLKCEEIIKQIEKVHIDFVEAIQSKKGLKITHNSIHYVDPTDKVKEQFESLLIKLVIALRRTFKIAEVIYDVKIDGPKDFTKYITNKYDSNSKIAKMIESDKEWARKLYDLRGKVEHSKLEISRFNVILDNDEIKYQIPYIVEVKDSILNFSKVALLNTFTYCEEITVLMLENKVDDVFAIYEVLDENRDKNRGFRFILDMNLELRRKIESQLK